MVVMLFYFGKELETPLIAFALQPCLEAGVSQGEVNRTAAVMG